MIPGSNQLRQLINLLLIRFMLNNDCLHKYVDPNKERTTNAGFFLAYYMSQEYYNNL